MISADLCYSGDRDGNAEFGVYVLRVYLQSHCVQAENLDLDVKIDRKSIVIGCFYKFLGATKHLYNWLCPSVGWLVGRLVCLSVTHSFDDRHVAPYWRIWPCFHIQLNIQCFHATNFQPLQLGKAVNSKITTSV